MLWLRIRQYEREGWDKLGCHDSENAMLVTLFQQSSKPWLLQGFSGIVTDCNISADISGFVQHV